MPHGSALFFAREGRWRKKGKRNKREEKREGKERTKSIVVFSVSSVSKDAVNKLVNVSTYIMAAHRFSHDRIVLGYHISILFEIGKLFTGV